MASLRPPPPGRRGRGARPSPVGSRFPSSGAPPAASAAAPAAPEAETAAPNGPIGAPGDRGGFRAARALFDARQPPARPIEPPAAPTSASSGSRWPATASVKGEVEREREQRPASVRALISKLNAPAAGPTAAERPALSSRPAPHTAPPVVAARRQELKSAAAPAPAPRSPVQSTWAAFEARAEAWPAPPVRVSSPATRSVTAASPVAVASTPALKSAVVPARALRSPVQAARAAFETRAGASLATTPRISTPVTRAIPGGPAMAASEPVIRGLELPAPTSTRSPVQAAKAMFEAQPAFTPPPPAFALRSSVQTGKAMFEARVETSSATHPRISTSFAPAPTPTTPSVPVVVQISAPSSTQQSSIQAVKAVFESRAAVPPAFHAPISTPIAGAPAPTAPAHVPVVTTPTPAPVQVEPVPSTPSIPTPAAPTPQLQASPARSTVSSPVAVPSELPEFHPFKLLLPITTVPLVPRSVDCVFDDAAIEMQKSVMKVTKKIFKKNKLQFEEFKTNARLYGSGFMDADEYLQSLMKDFGPLRALLLVPCLASIQPDAVKRQNLLFAARGYRLRNLDTLTSQCDDVDAHPTLVRSLSTESTVSTVSTVSSAPTEPAPVHAQNQLDPASAQREAAVETLLVKSEVPVEYMAVPIDASAMAVPMSLPTPVQYAVVAKVAENGESVQQLTEVATPTAVVVENHPEFKASFMEPHVIIEPASEVQAIPVSEPIAEPVEGNRVSPSVELVNIECKAPELQIDVVSSANTEISENERPIEVETTDKPKFSQLETSESVPKLSEIDSVNELSSPGTTMPVMDQSLSALSPPLDLAKKEVPQPQEESEPEAGPPSPVDNQTSLEKEVSQTSSVPISKQLVQQRTDSFASSDGDEGDRSSKVETNLFGEVITPTTPAKPIESPAQSKEEVLTVNTNNIEDLFGASNRVQTAPVAIPDDEVDAFSLFGRPSSSATSTPNKPRKSVTWGETQAKEIPARKTPPAPLIFGLATAGAYSDSDSDSDSDF